MRKAAKFTTAVMTTVVIGLTSATAASATPEASVTEGNEDCGDAVISQNWSGFDRVAVGEGELKELNSEIESAGGGLATYMGW